MHVTTKDSSNDGKLHTLTSVIEADGPHELASVEAKLSAASLSVERTASGGIEVVIAVKVEEPVAAPPVEAKPEPEKPVTSSRWGTSRKQ